MQNSSTDKRLDDYRRYMQRLQLVDFPKTTSWVRCEYNQEDDEIKAVEVNIGHTGVVEIPWFVEQFDKGLFKNATALLDSTSKIKVVHKNNIAKQFFELFKGLNIKEIDLSEFDTTGAKILDGMFKDCYEIESLDLSSFDTSTVEYMSAMFSNCWVLSDIKQNFNTQRLRRANNMFESTNIETVDVQKYDLSSLLTVNRIFYGCHNLKKITFNNPEQQTLRHVEGAFTNCTSLKEVNLKKLNMSSVTNLNNLFMGCSAIRRIYFPKDLRKVTQLVQQFANCHMVYKVDFQESELDSLSNMRETFSHCWTIKELQINKKYTKEVMQFQGTFKECKGINQQMIDQLDTQSAIQLASMFSDTSFIEPVDFSKLDTSKVIEFDLMFAHSKIKEGQNFEFDTQSAKTMTGMFSLSTIKKYRFNKDLFKRDVAIMQMFHDQGIEEIYFDGCDIQELTYENTSNFLAYCENLKILQFRGVKYKQKTNFIEQLELTNNERNPKLVYKCTSKYYLEDVVDIQGQVRVLVGM